MLSEVKSEYVEFSRPPYAVDPLDEQLVKQARLGGGSCRLLIESATLDDHHRHSLGEYSSEGVEVRQAASLPMKLAVFDGRGGVIALLDPVLTRPAWAAGGFEYDSMGQAVAGA